MGPKEKRKEGPTQAKSAGSDSRGAKRVKLTGARNISSESAHKALNEHNELDVASFVKSHQNEIKALEESMGLAKKGLSSRAFQSVPRELRRRTASHNVKRVPKRLRNRAAKEMREDNTPTVTSRTRELSGKKRLRKKIAEDKANVKGKEKEVTVQTDSAGVASGKQRENGKLASPVITVPKFKKRQINKSWLPTHVWHAKRAHMTDPKNPLWRYAIPLSPTEKCYRTTHRAGTMRGCVAWDMSYISTIGVHGEEKSLVGLLRALGVPESQLTGKQGQKWRHGMRSWQGWVREPGPGQTPIAPVIVVWEAQNENGGKRRLLVRVHPSAFLQLWNEVCKLAKMQRPIVKAEDLRFEIGSIQVTGPGATEALVGILSPVNPDASLKSNWSLIAGVNSLSSLPPDSLLRVTVDDPRLGQPHSTVFHGGSNNEEALLQMLTDWPFDTIKPSKSLLDGKARSDACRLLPSQKKINRRKGDSLPGQRPARLPTDPEIPVILYSSNVSCASGSTGTWTLMLPWKCTLPVWYSLMHYPLSSGGNPRLGGLEQQRQLHFESSMPWFPGDFPGTRAGWEWEAKEQDKRKSDWEKRPSGKRVEWKSLDLGASKKGEVGKGWACDWEHLLQNLSSDATMADSVPPLGLYQHVRPFSSPKLSDASPTLLSTVSISLLNRGHAAHCARIYRLPSKNKPLCDAWLGLVPSGSSKRLHFLKHTGAVSDESHGTSTQMRQSTLVEVLSADSISHHDIPTAADKSYPRVPGEEDLVGFVTSGNFNLGEGHSTGVGSILLRRMADDTETYQRRSDIGGLCIVREAGQSVGRLARWHVV